MDIDQSNSSTREPVIVFDIGGTWFRSGILLSNSRLIDVTKTPAVNYRTHPNQKVSELQTSLMVYLTKEARRLRSDFSGTRLRTVGVSMGAALNAHTGLILNSGPLWGPECKPFDLKRNLAKRDPSFNWLILNDISAALIRHVADINCEQYKKVSLVTVSTGIGARAIDVRTHVMPLDPRHGIQGEIGHIPIEFTFRGARIERVCDCGGRNHLNAFCSGRGIESLLETLPRKYPNASRRITPSRFLKGKTPLSFSSFAHAVKREDEWARELLDAVTLPLARLLVTAFTFDPEMSVVFVTGGVVDTLGEHYRRSLLKNLNAIGLYQITGREPSFFGKRVRTGIHDDRSGLIGAGLYARMHDIAAHPDARDHKQWTVSAQSPVRYDVREVDGLFVSDQSPLFAYRGPKANHSTRRFVVVDRRVHQYYGADMKRFFSRHGFQAHLMIMSISERQKTMATVLKIVASFSTFGLSRRSEPVIAVGGGVLLDIVGLAASLYKRGVPYIRVPTTLSHWWTRA